ncbi:hypothetical protein TWF481_010647 [Arthrobotrys musiformis]|uniref:Protein kinase domain-containing protein n=1 Tax=Arthrobotrys musiformis TaxID=47236 RepID=A0AAV9W3R9_9PEZI
MVAPPLRISKLRSTRVAPNSRYPRYPDGSLTEWKDVDDSIEKLLRPHLTRKFIELEQNAGVNQRALFGAVCDENQIIRRSERAYESPVVEILGCVFGIASTLDGYGAAPIIGDPDKIFAVGDQELNNLRVRLVVEYKTPWALELLDNLVEAFNEERSKRTDKEGSEHCDESNELLKAVAQLYGYMIFNSFEFGVLCTYEKLFLFQRYHDHDGTRMRVSRAFRHSDGGLRSPVAAITYICHHVANVESSNYSPLDSGPKPTETHILNFDPGLDFDGIFKKDSLESWKNMELHFSKKLYKNEATTIKGEIRHKSDSRHNHAVILKIYDITIPQNLEKAMDEIAMYEKLHNLQGKDIPILYAAGTVWGMFKVLVLEDCGEVAIDATLTIDFWSRAEQALKNIHQEGVLHGDVRLQNITISRSGVKFIDLGLSRIVDAEAVGFEKEDMRCLRELRRGREI